MIRFKKDVMIFSDAAYKATDGKASFGYVALIKGVIVDVGAWDGPKVASCKKTEAMAVLTGIKRPIENGFVRVHVWLDAKEMVQAIKGNFDWSINPIISDIKKLDLIFAHMEFSYIRRLLNSIAHLLAKHCYSSNRDLD